MSKKVLVLNPYIPTLGGGEKHMGYLCQFIEDFYKNDVTIDILVHDYNEIKINDKNYVTIEDINKQFDLKLKNTVIKKVDIPRPQNLKEHLKNKHYIENITKEYDIFINFMFQSKHIGKAKFNIYECMFPPKRFSTEFKGSFFLSMAGRILDFFFYKSYNCFISNSSYTQHWLSTYWKKSRKNTIIYPPVFWKKEIEGRYIESNKKNIIISVGRFFVASHSKKQLELVKFFVNNIEIFKDYEYHLVGAVSNLPDDLKYLDEIKKIASSVEGVYIHENCDYNKLIKLYGEAKIFWHGTGYLEDEDLQPEKMEHFGITTVEAMSFGVVPVVINKGGQKETVEAGVNGFLWDTEKECIEKTQELIKNDELRKKMAERSVLKSQDYSIDEFYKANRRIFDEKRL